IDRPQEQKKFSRITAGVTLGIVGSFGLLIGYKLSEMPPSKNEISIDPLKAMRTGSIGIDPYMSGGSFGIDSYTQMVSRLQAAGKPDGGVPARKLGLEKDSSINKFEMLLKVVELRQQGKNDEALAVCLREPKPTDDEE